MIRSRDRTDLPVERRDLLWLLGALTLAVAPHFIRLPIWASVSVVISFLWRLDLSLENRELPPRRISALLAVAATGATFLSYQTFLGRDAGVTLLVLMLSLKLLELRHARDGMFTLFLGLFVLLSSFFYSQTSLVAIYTLFAVWVFVAALLGLSRTARRATTAERLRPAAWMLAQALPVAMVLFLFFPRLPGPLWPDQQGGRNGNLGMSDSMSPGSLGELRPSDAPAFSVHFDGPIPASPQRYWRGNVLWDYDRGIWRTGPIDPTPVVPPTPVGPTNALRYTVVLEPNFGPWLLALDVPVVTAPIARMTRDRTLRANSAINRRIAYSMASLPDYRLDAELDPDARARALRLPAGENPKARAMAESWRTGSATASHLVQRALDYFRSESFYYTLSPSVLHDNPIDEFLFSTRNGFCEHFAGAFVFLMRAAGIPARVVLGYQGGEMSSDEDLLVVRQSDAHAWAEVWIEHRGWVRVDPTAAVAPQRIERGIEAALPSLSPFRNLALAAGGRWLQPLESSWLAANMQWNRWVLGYSEARQRSLLQQIGLDPRNGLQVMSAIAIGGGIALLMVAAGASWYARTLPPDPVRAQYDRLCRKLARRGIARQPDEGPVAFSRRATAALPEYATDLGRAFALYVELRYGRWTPRATWNEFRRAVRDLRL